METSNALNKSIEYAFSLIYFIISALVPGLISSKTISTNQKNTKEEVSAFHMVTLDFE
jgi:hypothetical protein